MSMLHILTLHWNKAPLLEQLKTTLLNNLQDIPFVWSIKDNGSSDNSHALMESWNDNRIHAIKYPHNRDNFSQGMNFLFREANPKDDDLVLMLNNDIVFNDDKSIGKMIALLRNDPEAGLIGAKLNYADKPDTLQHCGVLFHPQHGLPYHYRSGVVEKERDRQNRLYPIVTGALALTRASVFRELMFNEKFHWAFEDCDFAMRITHHLRKKVIYCGGTSVSHEESASLKQNPVNKMFVNSNCQMFLGLWGKHLNISLVEQYRDPKFNLYSGK